MTSYQQSTPVLAILHQIYDRHADAASWSWERLNEALRSTLTTLIRVGAHFAREDFATLAADKRLRFGFWAGTDNAVNSGERYYALAVEMDNRSACLSFEAWKGRKPFIYPKTRIALGTRLQWQGESVTCTSFREDGTAVVLCSYKPRAAYQSCPTCHHDITPYAREQILHRYVVTWEEMQAVKKAEKSKKSTPQEVAV